MVETVTVACKIPNGLTAVLRHPSRMDEKGNLIAGAVRATHVFKGPPRPLNIAQGSQEQFLAQGGFGLTHGVPEDFWAEWYANNIDNPVVDAKLVFAHAKTDAVLSAARTEFSGSVSGMEPVDPAKPPAGIEKLNEKG